MFNKSLYSVRGQSLEKPQADNITRFAHKPQAVDQQ